MKSSRATRNGKKDKKTDGRLGTAPKKTLRQIPVAWPDLLASHDMQGSGEDYPTPSALGCGPPMLLLQVIALQLAILLSLLLIAPAMGQQQIATTATTEEQNNAASGEATVSPTQVDIYTQREETRKRRDELHFHLYDVQVINRVGWDGFIRLPDPNELGWKDTVRISPLEDTIVAMRPVSPDLPFGVPESIRPLNPMEPIGSSNGFTNLDPLTGQPVNPPTTNEMFNFDWEYVIFCHILSHEENDMMRPVIFNFLELLPEAPASLLASSGTTRWTSPGMKPHRFITLTSTPSATMPMRSALLSSVRRPGEIPLPK